MMNHAQNLQRDLKLASDSGIRILFVIFVMFFLGFIRPLVVLGLLVFWPIVYKPL